MQEQQSLESFKKQVKECLVKYQHCTTQESERLMKDYGEILPEYFKLKLTPLEMALAMVMGY